MSHLTAEHLEYTVCIALNKHIIKLETSTMTHANLSLLICHSAHREHWSQKHVHGGQGQQQRHRFTAEDRKPLKNHRC